MGHAERSCLIGQRLADATGLEPERRSSLFYALLLKDAGCSTTAAKIATTFGTDDQQVKRESRLIDADSPRTSLGYLRRNVAPGAPLRERARHLRAVVAMKHGGIDELERMRCERGADVARAIGLDEDAAARSRSSTSTGTATATPRASPARRSRCSARIVCLAQTDRGLLAAAAARPPPATSPASGAAPGSIPRWSTPLRALERDDRASGPRCDDARRASALEPADRVLARRRRAPGPRRRGLRRRSSTPSRPTPPATRAGVAEIAVGIAAALGLDGPTRRATCAAPALLHDVGKLGVSNRILDKPGKLDDDEWAAMRRHPRAVAA